MMDALFFLIALIFEIFYICMFLCTLMSKQFRFWPPPTAQSWQFFVAWIVAFLVAVFYFLLGIVDFDSFILPEFHDRLLLAFGFFVLGGMLGAWAFINFPIRATIGIGDTLITNGPYRFTRNPQYIGDSLLILGYIFLTNSWKVGVIGLLGVVLNYLAAFIEEPWLEDRYGDAYLAYKARVPRFLGPRNTDAA
jgi:protein-S-isoprenylcysteine O-methyltransferase Ste14